MSELDGALIEAYRKTLYRVWLGDATIDLRIGAYDPRLDALFEAQGVVCGAFVTACNPAGVQRTLASNVVLLDTLRQDLRAAAYRVLEGCGMPPADQVWAPEPSLFALGMDCETASEWMRRRDQNAFVHMRLGQAPRLVLLR